jgi:hypothetical protein
MQILRANENFPFEWEVEMACGEKVLLSCAKDAAATGFCTEE